MYSPGPTLGKAKRPSTPVLVTRVVGHSPTTSPTSGCAVPARTTMPCNVGGCCARSHKRRDSVAVISAHSQGHVHLLFGSRKSSTASGSNQLGVDRSRHRRFFGAPNDGSAVAEYGDLIGWRRALQQEFVELNIPACRDGFRQFGKVQVGFHGRNQ